MKVIFFLILFSHISLQAKLSADEGSREIVVMGLNATEHGTGKKVSLAAYHTALSSALTAVHDSILPSLQESSRIPPALRKTLDLRVVAVGVGLTGEVGLGPLFNIDVRPRIRLIFTNSTNPIYPD
jgi:hypothetical protein